MRLSLHSDLSLRALLYLAGGESGALVSTAAIAGRFGVSRFHLQKAVLSLRRLGYIASAPGRNGGVRLARPPDAIRLGALVSQLERSVLIDCARGPCPLRGACDLTHALHQAERAFFDTLDRFTLADVAGGRTREALRRMMS
jgi:Rrf2 family nitric oxide-sensitive transcriptional repressor